MAHLPGPIGTVTVATRAEGEDTSNVTQAGPATTMPPELAAALGPPAPLRTG